MATFWRIRCLGLSQTSCSLSSYIPYTSMQNICLQGLRIRFEVEEEMGHLMLASSLSWLFQLSCRGERKLQGVPATGSGGGTFNYRLLAFDVWGPFSHPTEKAEIDKQDSCIAASLIHQAYYHEQNITVVHCAVLSGCCLTICTSHFLIEGSGGGSRVVCIGVHMSGLSCSCLGDSRHFLSHFPQAAALHKATCTPQHHNCSLKSAVCVFFTGKQRSIC